eukprot:6459156-Heterocapsa_arctica.AAC.1
MGKQRERLEKLSEEIRGSKEQHAPQETRQLDVAPSQEEQQAHYVTHLPRAAWCIISAWAVSSTADLHEVDGFEMGPPKKCIDYTYM